VRGAEGIAVVRPGSPSDSTWSEGSKNYIRNVEEEGSNPFTSTKVPVRHRKSARRALRSSP
jgi:hypothetical protein